MNKEYDSYLSWSNNVTYYCKKDGHYILGDYTGIKTQQDNYAIDESGNLVEYSTFVWRSYEIVTPHDNAKTIDTQNLYTLHDNDCKKIYDKLEPHKEIPTANNTIEFGFLLFNNHWVNFSHTLNEALPRLILYKLLYNINNHHLMLLIQRCFYTQYIADILELFGIQKDQIRFLEDNNSYNIKTLVCSKLCHGADWPQENLKTDFFLQLRKKLKVDRKTEGTGRVIYIARNDNYSLNRHMKNEAEVIEFLKCNYHAIIINNIAELNLFEKSKKLLDCDLLITPLGAQCMNILLSTIPNKILFINSYPFPYFKDLIYHISNKECTKTVIHEYNDNIKHIDINVYTSAYIVDIEKLNDSINMINK